MNSYQPLLDIIQRSSTGISIILNIILIQLILYRSPKQIGLYKYLMVYISVFELFFCMVELATMPEFYSRGSCWFVIVSPDRSILPSFLLPSSALLYCISFGTSLAIFGVQFVYRYLVLSGNSWWCVKSPRNIIIWMGSPILFAVVWGSCCHFSLGRNEYVDGKLRKDVLGPYHLTPDDIGFIGVYFFPILGNGVKIVNWRNVIGWSIMTSCTVISETIMVVFVIKCYTFINSLISLSTCSSQFRNIQAQLFYALAAQSLIPIIFMQIPGSFVFLLTFTENGTPTFGQIFATSVTFYLAIDALPTMFIIKSYRKTIIRVFCYHCKSRYRARRTQNSDIQMRSMSQTSQQIMF